MNQVQNISFHGQTVAVFSKNNQHYVAMKPIVENIGLDWVSQYKKIQRSEILKSGMVMMTIPATDGKTYETACLPLDYLNGWLFGVDAQRVKPEIRERLLTYDGDKSAIGLAECAAANEIINLSRVVSDAYENFMFSNENQNLTDEDFKCAMLELARLKNTVMELSCC